jgi:choice-of-anchor B domain-containing protein
MLDVSTPSNPTYKGCVSVNNYTHDAQCIVYPSSGADSSFSGHEICFNFDEDTLHVVDVTDKSNPVSLSTTKYAGVGYTHQGWLVDPSGDARYLLLDDELDEYSGTSGTSKTTTYIFDVAVLTKPKYVGKWLAPVSSIDHNQYVVDGLSYQSNYLSGLRIVDVTSLARDPTGGSVKEVGFFDVAPEDDASPQVEFGGAWSVYPYFESGVILVNSIERGLFSLKYTG